MPLRAQPLPRLESGRALSRGPAGKSVGPQTPSGTPKTEPSLKSGTPTGPSTGATPKTLVPHEGGESKNAPSPAEASTRARLPREALRAPLRAQPLLTPKPRRCGRKRSKERQCLRTKSSKIAWRRPA